MAQHSAGTALATQARGPQRAEVIASGSQALAAQFRAAQSFLSATVLGRIAGLAEVEIGRIVAECGVATERLAGATARVAAGPPDEVVQQVLPLMQGMSAASVLDLGRVCLGVGLSRDRADKALAAAP